MHEIGNQKKIITGIFLLLAVLLLGYNASEFIKPYDVPLIGASYESRLASDKWVRLEDIESNKDNTEWHEKIEYLISDKQPQAPKVEEALPIVKPAPEQSYDSEVLPSIAGTVKISKTNGSSRSAVIVEKKFYYENDTVAGFYIKEITEKGIYLTKGKRSWFIEAPKVSYSIDRGN